MKTLFNKLFFYLVLFFLPLQVQAQSWEPQAIGLLPIDYGVYSISVVNEDVVWAVAYDRTTGVPVAEDHIIKVLKLKPKTTTNEEDEWEVINVMEAEGRISFDIVAFDATTAFITAQDSGNGLGSGVFKTGDGGATWAQKYVGYAGGVWIRFFNQDDGVIINRSLMATTSDGGETWVDVSPGNIPAFQSDEYTLISSGANSCQVVGDTIWFGTNMGRVYRSINKGLNWDAFDTSFGNTATVISEAFKNKENGIAVDVSSSITKYSKTADGGETWANVTSSPDLRIRNINYVPGTESTLIGTSDLTSNPRTAYSVNFGETWRIIDENIPLRSTQFISSTLGWSTRARITSTGQAAMYKWDGSDIFECSPASESFPNNSLTHTGSGSSSTDLTFDLGSKNPSFTISNLNAKTNGSPNNRYIDEVIVSYVNELGATINHGTFSGNNTSSVNVDIVSVVQSVTVSLADGYDGNYNGTLSVSFSNISYCGADPGCPDADNDDVCDVDDVCPGFNDNQDADGDGVPDGCDLCPGSAEMISSFSPNPLTHEGTEPSLSSVTPPVGNTTVSFIINDLNAKTNGSPSKRFIDEVTISYIDGTGLHTLGPYSGDVQSSVSVTLGDGVLSVSVSLTDIYDGDTGNEVLSVSMTDVTSCHPFPLLFQSGGNDKIRLARGITLYPNPVQNELYIRFAEAPEEAEVILFDILGTRIAQYQMSGEPVLRINMEALQVTNQTIFVSISTPGEPTIIKRVLLMK